MAGKHRAPSTTGKTFSKIGIVALAAASPIVLAPNVALAAPSTDSILAAIASCESGNKNIATGIKDSNGRRLSTASGYWQIVNGTWRAHGGTQFAPTAIQASYSQQLQVARRILVEGQGIGAWSESRSCWSRRIGKVPAIAPVEEEKKPTPIKAKTTKKKKEDPKPKLKTPTATATAPVKSATRADMAKKVASSYVIKRGDTLSKIARHNGTTVSRLASLNRATVHNVNLIYAGARLRLR